MGLRILGVESGLFVCIGSMEHVILTILISKRMLFVNVVFGQIDKTKI